jgi:hypothetical protein
MQVNGQIHALTALAPGKDLGWAPEPVWNFWAREKSLASAGIQTQDFPAHSTLEQQ